ncbi:hypothetical protein V6N13_002037 [Hibiscus sabdariffa]
MASLPIFSFAPSTTSAGGSKEEKGFLDWVLGNSTKEDQFYETDPLLKKVEVEDKNTVSIPLTKKSKHTVIHPYLLLLWT